MEGERQKIEGGDKARNKERKAHKNKKKERKRN